MCLNIGKHPHYWIIDLKMLKVKAESLIFIKENNIKKYFCTVRYMQLWVLHPHLTDTQYIFMFGSQTRLLKYNITAYSSCCQILIALIVFRPWALFFLLDFLSGNNKQTTFSLSFNLILLLSTYIASCNLWVKIVSK